MRVLVVIGFGAGASAGNYFVRPVVVTSNSIAIGPSDHETLDLTFNHPNHHPIYTSHLPHYS